MIRSQGKLRLMNPGNETWKKYVFWCPGCNTHHWASVRTDGGRPNWTWNGSWDKPSFQPSINCMADVPELRCHFFVTDGQIRYQNDCHHHLNGQVIDMVDIDADLRGHDRDRGDTP